MQKARSHTCPEGHSAPTACRQTVSGTISLPSSGCFSPFPHGTGSLSVAETYLALEDGPPEFMRDSSCPALLGYLVQEGRLPFAYGPFTLYGGVFQRLLLDTGLVTSRGTCRCLRPGPSTPYEHAACKPGGSYGLGCSPFARRYSENRGCFLLLKVLRCFSSPRSPNRPYAFRTVRPVTRRGFPHSDIHGSTLAYQLPVAFRRCPRPSSPLGTKAFPICPS
jgi:hypothetical protein